MNSGHHAEHVGLQKHSVGETYPLAVVGYGDIWAIENIKTGKVACVTETVCGKVQHTRREWGTVKAVLAAITRFAAPGFHRFDLSWQDAESFRHVLPVQPEEAAIGTTADGRWNWYGAAPQSAEEDGLVYRSNYGKGPALRFPPPRSLPHMFEQPVMGAAARRALEKQRPGYWPAPAPAPSQTPPGSVMLNTYDARIIADLLYSLSVGDVDAVPRRGREWSPWISNACNSLQHQLGLKDEHMASYRPKAAP
jgi:hypothetical protein